MGDIDLYGDFNEEDDAAAISDDDDNAQKAENQADVGDKIEVLPKKRKARTTQFRLNEARLMDLQKGVSVLEKHYKGIKFLGKRYFFV